MAETVFVGSGWDKTDGKFINISLKLAELNKLTPNQYGDIKLTVVRRNAPDERSKATHFVKVDDYVPQTRAETPVETRAQHPASDLPF